MKKIILAACLLFVSLSSYSENIQKELSKRISSNKQIWFKIQETIYMKIRIKITNDVITYMEIVEGKGSAIDSEILSEIKMLEPSFIKEGKEKGITEMIIPIRINIIH